MYGSKPFRRVNWELGGGRLRVVDHQRAAPANFSRSVQKPLCPRRTFISTFSWNCDDRASGRQRHLEERPPLNPSLHDFNHDPLAGGIPQARFKRAPPGLRAVPLFTVTFLKDMNWPSLMVYCNIYSNEERKGGTIWVN